MQLGIIQIADSPTRYHNNILPTQLMLVEAKGISDEALQAVAFDRKLNAFLPDHES
mgnify:CR=1 FL=1